MPSKVLPTREEFGWIWKDHLKDLGFFITEGLTHFYHSTKNVRAEAPSFREGAELGFGWQDRELTTIGWTSYVPSLRRARENDRGWIVIEQDGDPVYFIPLNRTGKFVSNFDTELRIARLRIAYRPSCPVCKERMKIAMGKGLGSRYWRCPARHARESWDTEAFLVALPPGAKRYLFRRRAARERWQNICRRLGKKIRQAMLIRKKWRRISVLPDGF